MNNISSKWLFRIIGAIAIGFCLGEVVSSLLGFVLVDEKWSLLLSLFVPLFIVIDLIIVLWKYQKEKDDMINGGD